MENYIIVFFFLLKCFISILSKAKNSFFYKYLICLFLKNILYSKKCVVLNKNTNISYIWNIRPVLRTNFILKNVEKTNNDNIAHLNKKIEKWGKNQNIVFIENTRNNDENKVNYLNGEIKNNNGIQEIKYLSNLQKNFIYLLERNNNVIVHSKTSSGKTTISLFYFVLKHYFNSEIIFDEDIEREKFLNQYYYDGRYKSIFNLNKQQNNNKSKLKYIPFSEKYSEIYDIRENKDLLLEESSEKNVLKKGDKILILCPSKELCVQTSQNILSFTNNENGSIIKLFIDKHDNSKKVKNNNVSSKSRANHSIDQVYENIEVCTNSGSNLKKKKKKKKGILNNHNFLNENTTIDEMENIRGALFLVGTPLCFKNYMLNLEKNDLKHFLESIKYVFFDEIDKLLPSQKNRSSNNQKKFIKKKKKTAYMILETIMYMNPKKLNFIGCSSTLNRELHRKIFNLLSLNKNNLKKKNVYLLREKNNMLEGEGIVELNVTKGEITDTILNDMMNPNNDNSHMNKEKKDIGNDEQNRSLIDDINYRSAIEEETSLNEGNQDEEDIYNMLELNNPTNLQKYVIKVQLPKNIHHFYHITNDDLFSNKIKGVYEIVESFKMQKILILIKNGYSLMNTKKYLMEKNIFSLLLHERLEISKNENNHFLKKMCKNYEEIKNLKEIDIKNNEGLKYTNKFPIIISSFDSIRGFHINDLDIVILCNKPTNLNEYIHLCGRVGRRKKVGYSIILENDKNINIIKNWLVNIKTNFYKLHLKNNATNNINDIDDNIIEKKKNNINYITSCILNELRDDIL
ncbi:DEAD box helicase, putative [Plasmodium berghei]|uniref:ATP-dependent RNA helicase n=2 Tax=Plasmodium berghei TaxID=5821 RepID=A0A509ATS5_PLABA|nr:DEAD box helicase, putative [Plasmodium berghei ANKA]CXJ13221.1 DEAD box helicase, putative [Plasmodium berghei]SCN28289.1 DEAD box helicase, putative [Plasmodium berghei]SCO64045.1 DEAD box helicase, putative [Plasmodium berghei]VUC58178.1 DEAD box helicase, putative [Plasmodium berghei ANKA]|eukprot:XP_034423941.1 DEAD box helicase, putative [Plasmodium berghei ANKA]